MPPAPSPGPSVMTGLNVTRQRVQFPPGTLIGEPYCEWVPYDCCVDTLVPNCVEGNTGFKIRKRLWVQVLGVTNCTGYDTTFTGFTSSTPSRPSWLPSDIIGAWFQLDYAPFTLGASTFYNWSGTRIGYPDSGKNSDPPGVAFGCIGDHLYFDFQWGIDSSLIYSGTPPNLGQVAFDMYPPYTTLKEDGTGPEPMPGQWGPPGSLSRIIRGRDVAAGPGVTGSLHWLRIASPAASDCVVAFHIQDTPPPGVYPDVLEPVAGTPVVKGWWVKKVEVTLPSGYYWAAPIPDCVDCTGSPVSGSGGNDVTNLVLSRAYAPAWMLAEAGAVTRLNPTSCCGSGSGGGGGGTGCLCEPSNAAAAAIQFYATATGLTQGFGATWSVSGATGSVSFDVAGVAGVPDCAITVDWSCGSAECGPAPLSRWHWTIAVSGGTTYEHDACSASCPPGGTTIVQMLDPAILAALGMLYLDLAF